MLELVNAHSTGYLGIIYNIYNLVQLLVTIIGKDNEGTLNLMGDGCWKNELPTLSMRCMYSLLVWFI